MMIKSFINKLKKSSLAKDSIWIMSAKVIRLLIQSVYFIIIARTLGVEDYGAFVSVVALINIIVPFASWGSEFILLKNVSRNYNLFEEYWGNALFTIFLSGLGLTIVILLNSSIFLTTTIPFIVILFVAISDLLFSITLKTAGKAFQAVGRLNVSAQLEILPSASRLAAALCFISFFPQKGIAIWAGLYMIATIFAAGIGIFFVYRYLGKPKLAISRLKAEILQGFYFSVSSSSSSIYANADKTMLARLSTLEATGIYAAAYRLIDVSFVPILSLVFASYPRFFRQGAKGIHSSFQFAKKLLPVGIAYSLAIAIAVWLFAPVIPFILGAEYSESVEVLRWLALLPFLRCLHTLGGNTLTGADLQGLRTIMQVTIALFNFALNLWLIPLFSWKGAIWSTLGSDSLLALVCWSIVAWYYVHHDRGGETS
ncbi:MAG: oligosaccharide flippase family protein [Cyanobacteria bacterium P01_A01_bin.83]